MREMNIGDTSFPSYKISYLFNKARKYTGGIRERYVSSQMDLKSLR